MYAQFEQSSLSVYDQSIISECERLLEQIGDHIEAIDQYPEISRYTAFNNFLMIHVLYNDECRLSGNEPIDKYIARIKTIDISDLLNHDDIYLLKQYSTLFRYMREYQNLRDRASEICKGYIDPLDSGSFPALFPKQLYSSFNPEGDGYCCLRALYHIAKKRGFNGSLVRLADILLYYSNYAPCSYLYDDMELEQLPHNEALYWANESLVATFNYAMNDINLDITVKSLNIYNMGDILFENNDYIVLIHNHYIALTSATTPNK